MPYFLRSRMSRPKDLEKRGAGTTSPVTGDLYLDKIGPIHRQTDHQTKISTLQVTFLPNLDNYCYQVLRASYSILSIQIPCTILDRILDRFASGA
jgi:hypothetical protein